MFNLSRLFKSRWFALLWAAGVLFTAWQFAEDPDDGGEQASSAQASAIANAL